MNNINVTKKSRSFQICTQCVMDTSDPDIYFDENGVCSHCKKNNEDMYQLQNYTPQALEQLVEKIKAKGKGKEYDCVIGLSGGVDSSYVAYLAKKLGLRPLAVHLDNGWDSELAVNNIEKIVKTFDIDLHTVVLDWEEFKKLQVAFLKASVPDAEIPTDHAITASIFQTMLENNIPYFISGANISTEGTMPAEWAQGHFDWRYIKSVDQLYGTGKLLTFPHMDIFERELYYHIVKGFRYVFILNHVQYNKLDAIKTLENEFGWRSYGDKHFESVYTRFFQGYILPNKFNIDKRRAHFSRLIISGQVKRSDAIEILKQPTYAPSMMEEDREYVVSKLGLTQDEFDEIMTLPIKSYHDYPNYSSYYKFLKKLRNISIQLRFYPFLKGIYSRLTQDV